MSVAVQVAKTTDIPPGRARSIEVAGHKIAVFHVNGTYYAIENRCPHYGKSLSAGWVHGTTVTCPWHGAIFDLTSGDVLSGPARRGVQSYQVRVEDQSIYVDLPEVAVPTGAGTIRES
ncbi:MAG TPA: non-heme iron oxygenase ferredoxin subunit [Candidatus Tectomicrobia bacterium]|jgi:nitrite reductase/ring-hydroxylating ferredoxin subunit